jgi:tetratricopeptide (TPR) repeat protein
MKKSASLRRSLAMGVVLIASLGVFALLAQQQGGPTGGESRPTPSPSPTPTPSPTPGRGETQQPFPGRQESPFPGQQQQQRFPEFERPIFIQGKVMMEDGTPAPPSVVIERVCNGRAIPEAYTDSKGRFSFQVGQNSSMMADASYSGIEQPGIERSQGGLGSPGMGGFGGRGISERDLMGCELRASLPGYRSTSVELTGRRMFDNPDVGTLVLRKLANVEGFTISMTTLKAPNNAKKAFEKGAKEAAKKKWDKAQVEFEKAVAIYPEYAVAWHALGQVYEAMEKPDEARKAYEKALAADSKFVNPYLQLALLDARKQDWRAVADTTDRVIKLNPYDFPDAYFFNSVAHLNLNNLSAAEKSAREAIKLNAHRRYPQVEHVLGIALAQQNNLQEATEHLKKYLELAPQAQNADAVRKQLSQIEAFLGRNAAPPQQ